MNLPATVVKVCKPFGKLIFRLKKHSPEILLGLGVLGYGGSVLLAGKAGEKARKAQDSYLKDYNKKKFIKGYVKAWGPSVGLFAASTAAVVGGHVILRGRYIATGVALAATKKAFDAYRGRVVAKEGADADISYRNGFVEKVDLEENDEGTTEVIHEMVQNDPIDPTECYLYVVDERCQKYVDGDPHSTLANLRNAKKELNMLLEASIDNRITLREALIRTGFKYALKDEKIAKIAGRSGWRWGSERGDNYISFGPMFEKILENPSDYYMGRTPPLIIEFNCDGDIYSL